MVGNGEDATETRVARLAADLLGRVDSLTELVAERILQQIDVYGDSGIISRDDLHKSVRTNLEYVLSSLGGLGHPDLAAPRYTGRRRAEQGAPLASIQSAYRVAFRLIWDTLVAEARQSDMTDGDLVRIATEVWALNDEFTASMIAAYRDTMTERMLAREQERSALVEAILQGKVADTATVWEAAEVLGLPYHGHFAVVAAEVPATARPALPNIENRLLAKGFGSAWRLLPDLHVGIVSMRQQPQASSLVSQLRSLTELRCGVSPLITTLEDSPRALHQARIAMASLPAGEPAVTLFDESPIPLLVVSSPTTSYRVCEVVLGPLLSSPMGERETLLETLEVYFAVGGSTVDAGRRLYCHPNTVRHRLRRIEHYTGKSLEDPRAAAELYIALEALRRLPEQPEV